MHFPLISDFFSQIVKGVQYIDSIGIAHRDLKPDNVLMFVNQSLPNDYLLKITDFGLAHIFGDQSSF
jgi:protein-serine/threonine kinase